VNSAFHPSTVGKSSTNFLAGVKAGSVQLCRMTGNSVLSHMTGDAPWLCDGIRPMNSYNASLSFSLQRIERAKARLSMS